MPAKAEMKAQISRYEFEAHSKSRPHRHGSAKRKVIIRVALFVLLVWIIGKFAGCFLLLPGLWGPKVVGNLPDGGQIIFQSRAMGRESDDRLTWIRKDGKRHDYWVDRVHGGFLYVVIKVREDGKGMWVESDEKVGASLDLETGEFRSEIDPQFEWARYGEGQTIAEGKTWSWRQLLVPW
ncbi:MAG: hypothetical protein KAV00_07420 [Phycisphaerae bacterium]|nr:hypothetical protein [Phycisphaerae bacterium]